MRDDIVVLEAAIAKGLVDESKGLSDLQALAESIAQGEHIVGVAVYGPRAERLAVSSGLADDVRIDSLARRALASRVEIRELHEGPTHLEHAFPIAGSGRVAIAVVVRDIGYVDDLVWHWTKNLFVVGGVMALAMFVIAWPLVRRTVSAPLERVMSGVEEVAAGKLEVR